MNKQDTLALRYAKAFMNMHGDELTLDHVRSIERIIFFLSEHRSVLFPLSLTSISPEDKIALLAEFFKRFEVDGNLKKLITLLVEHKRSFLLGSVLRALCWLYRVRNNVAFFKVKSSHTLSPAALAAIQQFLVKKTKKTVICSPLRDVRLIAGIRLESDTMLWEYSVAQQLKTIASCSIGDKELKKISV